MSDSVLSRLWSDRRVRYVAGAVVVFLIALFVIGSRGAGPPKYFTSPVTRGDIKDAVDLTATVNAVKMVQVGSQVSGTIAALNVDFNSPVHVGQVIALIDPSLLKGALKQAEADSEGAEANLTAAQANLEKANAALVPAEQDYERTQGLAQKDYESQQTLAAAKANYEMAKASVTAAEAAVVQARATVVQKSATIAVARTNLDYTVIRSPVNGVVVARNVDVGQTVAASLQAPTIFTIAQDLTKMQLYAKTDESDVGRVRVKQSVTFKVDAYPKETFHGIVHEIRMNATTVQNVVTYDAIIDFDNPDLKLFPGMTAYVNVPVASVTNALKVPNSALRFHPSLAPEVIRAMYAKAGIRNDSASTVASTDAGGAPPIGVGGKDAGRPRASAPEQAIVWKHHDDGSLEPASIALGITDHANTEAMAVLGGTLKEGDELVTGAMVATRKP